MGRTGGKYHKKKNGVVGSFLVALTPVLQPVGWDEWHRETKTALVCFFTIKNEARSVVRRLELVILVKSNLQVRTSLLSKTFIIAHDCTILK